MSQAVPVVAARSHQLSRLASGVRLITAALPGRSSVAVAFMFGVGSRLEDRTSSGLAHFIEHMVFKGAGRFPSARAISQEIEGLGGMLNAETDREATVFWTSVPAEHLGRAVAVLADMVRRPLIAADEVVKERQVVIEELRATRDSPQDRAHQLFDEVMWPDHPLGWDIGGREETVRTFDRELCLRHLSAHYRPERLVVSVAGAVDHREASRLLESELRWGGEGTEPDPPLPAAPAPPEGRLRVEDRPTEQAHLLIGARAASLRDPDRYAVDMVNGLLGDGMASRLFVELREERALAYDVHSFTVRLSDSGALVVYLGCDRDRAPEAMRAAVHELERLAEEAVPAAELARVREYLRGRLLLGLESTSGMCSFLGQQELATGEILEPAEAVARLAEVTAADVMRVARGLLAGGLRAAVVGPFTEQESFATMLGHV